MFTPENLSILLQLLTLGGIIFAGYKYFRDPDVKTQQEIALIKEGCKLKHKSIDDNIVLIKENHLKHIEADIQSLTKEMVEVKTLLSVFLKQREDK